MKSDVISRQGLHTVSILLLIALLCSFVSHAQHVELANSVMETQDCKLCQHNIDTPKGVELTVEPDYVCQSHKACYYSPVYLQESDYQQPQLRGPPVFR